MDWLLSNPQIHSIFSSLNTMQDDNYVISSDALATLEEINYKLTCEDQTLRTYRRAIGFGQKVKIDLIPLLINAKDSDIIDATIRILVNLTVPIECLFSVDVMYRTEMGRHTIFEINNLLLTSKECFTDSKCTKSIIDHMKSILESDIKLSKQQCDNINNCLLLLRNILHIPEHNNGILLQSHHIIGGSNNCGISSISMQNTIIWNLFIQNIDKLLIYLMTNVQRSYWGVTMVQLIALMYKDQHVSTLQKLLSVWFEASLSESSEDNESNTSPPKQGSGDSSPMLTSDPTSDSSDNGGSGKQGGAEDRRQANLNKETEQTLQEVSRKGHEYQNAILRVSAKQQSHQANNNQQNSQIMGPPNERRSSCEMKLEQQQQQQQQQQSQHQQQQQQQTNYSPQSIKQRTKSPHSGKCCGQKRECPSSQSELSDCGYGTQVENQESISTSSNEDDGPQQKPIHQKPPYNQKQRNKQRIAAIVTMQDKKEWRRKKLVKRSKSNLINMKGLVQHTPTDDDISNILKEFTVDFLIKGYGHLVHELHAQLLSDLKIQMDTSHFFWLVTYFLKFAAQLELDLEHITSVLSFDVVSFLTYEGVSICEELELTSKQEGSDLKPYLRRMHLVVTAIREFLQALETYKKITHLSKEDRQHLRLLQIQISSTEDLRCLFILLIRTYNPTLHTKQYLQDLIVTNHILLIQLDGISKSSDYNVNVKMMDHIAQFASVEIMHHYGLLLEDFYENGEFVNDCIFTMMHHIGGDLGQVATLFQPIILKTYSRIWETEYELCDDWSDLIEYVIHKFMNTPQKSPITLPSPTSLTEITKEHNMEHANCIWSQEEMDTLYWYYVQSKKIKDIVGKIVKLFRDNGNKRKTRISIVQQLLQQDIITLVEYDDLMKFEDAEYQRNNTKTPTLSTESGIEIKDNISSKPSDDIQVLKDRLLREQKGKLLTWLQKVLVECCFVKLNISAGKIYCKDISTNENDKIQIMEPVSHHCILKKKSIPVVPWNCDQSSVMLYQPFVLLLHKLGFHLPADSGKLYIRIPDFWTADILYNVAIKLGPIDKSLIKFDVSLLGGTGQTKSEPLQMIEENTINEGFAIPKVKHSNSIIRFTPDPSSTPLVPNWLQLVMRSKCPPDSPSEIESVNATGCTSFKKFHHFNKPSLSSLTPTKMHQTCILSDDDSIMKPTIDNKGANNNQLYHQQQRQQNDDIMHMKRNMNNSNTSTICRNLDNEYSAMVASVYESEMSNYETESVASDLTRMYVSDEDDKNSKW